MLDQAKTSNSAEVSGRLEYGDLVLDPGRGSLSCGERLVAIGLAERLVLRLLVRNGSATVPCHIPLEALRPVSAKGESRMPILRAAVLALRNHLRMIGARTIIQVSTRAGYHLASPEPRVDRLRVAFDTTFGRS